MMSTKHLFVVLFSVSSLLVLRAKAHSYLTVPVPISNTEQCRVGGPPGFQENCPGPCPNYGLRNDTAPDMPTARYFRGENVEIRYTKNNHEGGFLRLSLVPIDEMHSKESHEKYSFYLGCWSMNQFECNDFEKHRDCHHDFANLGYKIEITIPTVYPDGVYVLGFTWFGGGVGLDSFGDYYDCAYVEIQGGDYEQIYTASHNLQDGHCLSQSDKIGDCAVEPCYEHKAYRRSPQEEPKTIESVWLENAQNRLENQVIVSRHSDFGISGLRMIDSELEKPLLADEKSVIYLNVTQKISFEPITFGEITYVQWFVNGQYQHDAKSYPWSIADHELTHEGIDYFDWIFPFFNTRCYITAVVYNGPRRAYFSQEYAFSTKSST